MGHQQQHRTRISVDCTSEEKRYIKMLAARENMSMSEYLLSFARIQMPKRKCDYLSCDGKHEPNEETAKILRETDKGKNIESYESIDDFWESLGFNKHA